MAHSRGSGRIQNLPVDVQLAQLRERLVEVDRLIFFLENESSGGTLLPLSSKDQGMVDAPRRRSRFYRLRCH